MARVRARRTFSNSLIIPLRMNIHLPWEKGWQLTLLTAVPVEARTWPKNRAERICAARLFRLASF